MAGLPGPLTAAIWRLSRESLDDVTVHYDSHEPARLGAKALARAGREIHLAPGHARHLPHEAWHVVQQRRGLVLATGMIGGAAVNDSSALENDAERMGALAHRMAAEHALPMPAEHALPLPATTPSGTHGGNAAEVAAGEVVQGWGLSSLTQYLPSVPETWKEYIDPRRWRTNPFWRYHHAGLPGLGFPNEEAEVPYEAAHSLSNAQLHAQQQAQAQQLQAQQAQAQRAYQGLQGRQRRRQRRRNRQRRQQRRWLRRQPQHMYHTRERHGAEHTLQNIRARLQPPQQQQQQQQQQGGPANANAKASAMVNVVYPGQDIRIPREGVSSRFATPAWHSYARNVAMRHAIESLRHRDPLVQFDDPAGPGLPPRGAVSHKFDVDFKNSGVGLSVNRADNVVPANKVRVAVSHDEVNHRAWITQFYPHANEPRRRQGPLFIPHHQVEYDEVPWFSTKA